MFKPTEWKHLDASQCRVLAVNPEGGLRVKHPDLKRPRWFNRSRGGNLYSRYTGKETDSLALGFMIEGVLSVTSGKDT